MYIDSFFYLYSRRHDRNKIVFSLGLNQCAKGRVEAINISDPIQGGELEGLIGNVMYDRHLHAERGGRVGRYR